MNRRAFLGSVLAAAAPQNVPIIDSHIHLFDIARPQGVPWPPKDSRIYKSALPDRYRKLAAPHGIVGAIEIECSPWLDDNQWVLDIAAKAPIIVGTIGNVEPGTPDFGKHLERLHKNPLFLGIRYGNLWNYDAAKGIANPKCIADLKLLASANLTLDTANPDPALINTMLRLSDRVPNLRIVLDHLPGLRLPKDATARKACDSDLRQLAARPGIYAKVSGIVGNREGRLPVDRIWDLFGADRLFYGSDWPNSEQWAEYPEVFRIAREFISSKSQADIEKFYWRNSLKAYRWKKRDPQQPA